MHVLHARTSVTALYIDLDGFTSVNDTFGHAAGDEVLRTVGARLTRLTRRSDLVGRLGGDEFVMLVDGFALDVRADTVAERVLAALHSCPGGFAGGLSAGPHV